MLLNEIIGASPPIFRTSGRILLDGKDLIGLGPCDRRIGRIFQDDLLFPHMSVGANFAFALHSEVRKRTRHAAVETVEEEALSDANIPGFADRDPATQSGGQGSSTALTRVLLSKPHTLLLDEPFSRLNATLRDRVRTFVFDIIRKREIPALLLTHNAEDARAAGGRVVDPLGQPVDLG